MADPVSTWGIPPPVRRILSARILELRALLEEDARRQLAALGITTAGVSETPVGRALDAEEVRIRELIATVIQAACEAGMGTERAVGGYINETAFTLLDRMVAFRSLEERDLLLVDGQPETLVRIDPIRGTSSLIWRTRAEAPEATARDVARAAYRRGCLAASAQIRVLFDPDNGHSVLFPLLATWDRVLAVLNDPMIPATTYTEDEILGWVYQYWNTAAKDAIYAKLGRGGKIQEPEELTAASTLYTERYMVDYLLQNTLGALWIQMHPESTLSADWPYYVRAADAVHSVTRKPKRVRDISLVDPCVGSGHFLVRAFDLFVQLYAEEAIEDPAEVPALILEHNLHGFDIDRRATQIAALALYLKGRQYSGPTFVPDHMNLLATDVALTKDLPLMLSAGMSGDRELQDVIRTVWAELRDAPLLGSLLHPETKIDHLLASRRRKGETLFLQDDPAWERLRNELLSGLQIEFEREAESADVGRRLFGANALRAVNLIESLGRQYDVVVMNPPYAGSRNLADAVKRFLTIEYGDGKADLASAFILRAGQFARPGGLVGMVTPQAWMYLRTFAALRDRLLRSWTLNSLAHLGPRAFEEISGEVVSTVLVTASIASPTESSRFSGIRLVGLPANKKMRRLKAAATGDIYWPKQSDMLAIPESPIVYWLRPRFLELLRTRQKLSGTTGVKLGLCTGDNDQFVRLHWEVCHPGRGLWRWCARGGGYRKWSGLEHYVAHWDGTGAVYASVAGAAVRNTDFYFKPGLTYPLMAQGAMSVRAMSADGLFEQMGVGVFPPASAGNEVLALLNTRQVSYLLRVTTQDLKFNAGYTSNLPVPPHIGPLLSRVGQVCRQLKDLATCRDPTERRFLALAGRDGDGPEDVASAADCLLLSIEGLNERLVFDAYELDETDVQAVLDETGTPAGWHPLVTGFATIPEGPAEIDIPEELSEFLASREVRTVSPSELAALMSSLRLMYEAGPDARAGDSATAESEDDEEAPAALGAQMPIPTETFLEELSQNLQIHPISVYWMVKQLRERDKFISVPLAKSEFEDYASVTILRLLGHRWPEQDAYEAEHGPLFDPALVDRDGIVPLVACGNELTIEGRIRDRLQRDFGVDGAHAFLHDFRKYVGRDLADWVRRDFFKRHVKQFKNRPIVWHLRSREGAFEVFVLYHRLSRETLVKLRAEYAGPRIGRLKGEAARAMEQGGDGLASDLQVEVEDIEAFRRRIEGIERGDELRDRIRCRWKEETSTGRRGPYAPDIDDGVKVNIRPFQEAGLLAANVIAKW